MNIIFLVTSFWAFGELLIAIEFANELRDSGYNICFIVPQTHRNAVVKNGYACISLIPKSTQLNRILFNEVKYSFNPHLVILSDFLNYNFAYRHYGISKKDLNIFKTQIATFDNFHWSYPRKCMDTYGFKSGISQKIDLEYYGPRIIPCPIVNPDSVDETNVYTYALVNKFIDTSNKEKIKNRLKYGFYDNKDRIILVSYAKWQNEPIQESGVNEFIDLSNRLFDRLIQELSQEFHINCVGIKDKILGECDNIHYYSSLDPKTFDELVSISDIYISRNMTSTSMVRIALSGVRCVNIINSIDDKKTIEEIIGKEGFAPNIKPYKYLMFPVGWYNFLSPIFYNNPYTELITQIEQFNIEQGVDIIRNIIYEDSCDYVNLTNILKGKLSKLTTPNEIVKSILNKDSEGKK